MFCRSSCGAWRALAILALAATGTMFTYAGRALADEERQEGRIVDLSADGTGGVDRAKLPAEAEEPTAPTFWLGIQGQPLDSGVLRTHLQLADDVGVVVENVMKDSPAEKAGLRQHDVLIAVNGEQITEMPVLQKAVAASEGQAIELKLIRLAKEMSIKITPERLPAHLAEEMQAAPGNPFPQLPGNMPMGDLQAMLEQLQRHGAGGGARMFGPGMIFNGQQFDLQSLPGGVQVSITREDDKPAKVTVRKGDQSWTIEGDDQQALKELPDDVRPFVERLLQSQRPGAGMFQGMLGGNLEDVLPDNLGNFQFRLNGEQAEALQRRAERASERMLERIEQLEEQLQELEQHFDHQESEDGANPATDPTKT
jgi:hypothetical protein